MRVRACVGGGSTEAAAAAAAELGLWVTTIGRQVGGGWTRGGFSRGGGGLRATGRVELPACVQCVIYGLAGRQPATVVVVVVTVAVVVVVRVRVVRVCALASRVFKILRGTLFFRLLLKCVDCKGRGPRDPLLTRTPRVV
ncbi:hypothetical protein QTP88_012505 [Uroleucon formosanum]